jgi:hypothetical protein
MSVTCPYTSGGTYQPSVWVRRNDLIGHFTTNVTYGNALPASPSLSFLINGNTSPTVALGQSLYFTWPSSSGIDTIVASSPNWTLPSNPTLTCTQSCGNAVADTYGKQTYWLEASGPLGTITQSVVVNVTTAIASSANQAGYNYSKGN